MESIMKHISKNEIRIYVAIYIIMYFINSKLPIGCIKLMGLTCPKFIVSIYPPVKLKLARQHKILRVTLHPALLHL